MYLSVISCAHGTARPIAEPGCAGPEWIKDLMVTCRESTTETMDLALEAATRTLASTRVVPDVIVCATETAGATSAADADSQLATALGCPSAVVLFVGGMAAAISGCCSGPPAGSVVTRRPCC